jgi:hypothetical protein
LREDGTEQTERRVAENNLAADDDFAREGRRPHNAEKVLVGRRAFEEGIPKARIETSNTQVTPAHCEKLPLHTGQLRVAQIGQTEICPIEIGSTEITATKDSVGEVRPGEVRLAEIRSAEQSPRKVRTFRFASRRSGLIDGFASRQALQAAFLWRSRKTWSISVIACPRSDNH